jgi:2-polyprenyl-3-methyl-5-hydroxy-6-metoxy-1,4-benzoquinol methylase
MWGGAGVYALPLAKQRYEVHLIDAVDLYLEQARTYAAESGVALAQQENRIGYAGGNVQMASVTLDYLSSARSASEN